MIPHNVQQMMTALRPPFLLATTPTGPPEKNNGVKPGRTIVEEPVAAKMTMEMTVPKVQNKKPNVAEFGENGRMAATSMPGIASGTTFSWIPLKDSVI